MNTQNNSEAIIKGWERKAQKEKFGGIFTSILETHMGFDIDRCGGSDTGMEMQLTNKE